MKSLGLGGRQVAITSVGTRRVEFDLADFYHNTLRLIGVDTMKLGGEEIARILDALRPGFEDGHLHAHELTSWPFARAIEAYDAVASGSSRTKNVLLPNNTTTEA